MKYTVILHLILKIFVIGFALVGLIFTLVFIGMHFEIFNVRGSIDERNDFFIKHQENATSTLNTTPCINTNTKVCDWNNTPEWVVVSEGLRKDKATIIRVAHETDIPERMIATVVIPEQIRFFTSEREVFKRYFEPLKILGSLSQFSLGVSGIKETTAHDIEEYAGDPTSPFYPEREMSSLFAYGTTTNHDDMLFNRLTDPHDHYFSYLYTAMYIKEIEAQWKSKGYDISKEPGIIATLWNIGFENSHPNSVPKTGGAPIETGGKIYSFGELGEIFYFSNDLVDIFPRYR